MGEPMPASQNQGPTILAVVYSVTFVASLFVAGRLFSRRRKLGRWAVDDYIILACLVCIARFPLSLRGGTLDGDCK